jgi:hypothetical protein
VRDDEVPVIVTDPDVRFGTYAFADTVSGHAPRRWQVGRWSVGS